MKSNYLAWILGGGLVLIGGYYVYTTKMSGAPKMMDYGTPTSMTVTLDTQSGLGQSGTATIINNAEGKAVVELVMTGGTFPDPQPAHIHTGSCPKPGAVKYPLTNVVAGKSSTTLSIGLDELKKSTEPLAINVHKSAAQSAVYTACGNLSK